MLTYKTNKREENDGKEIFCSSQGRYWCLSWQIFILIIEKVSFHIDHVRIIGSTECQKTRIFFYDNVSKDNIKLKKHYAEKISETTSIERQSEYWDEVTSVEYFPN